MSKRLLLSYHNEIHAAHRGASDAFPENTMVAFYEAARLSAHCIELDVHLTADDEVVVLHDETLDRTTTGSGFVADRIWEELKNLDAGVWKGPQFAGIPIPRLSDVLDWLPTHMYLNIELKGTATTVMGLAERVLQEVGRYRCTDRVLISSFKHDALAHTRACSPDIALGALYHHRPSGIFHLAEKLNLSSLHPHWSDVDAAWVTEAKKRNLRVWTWTLTERSQVEHCRACGVQGFIANDISLVRIPSRQDNQPRATVL